MCAERLHTLPFPFIHGSLESHEPSKTNSLKLTDLLRIHCRLTSISIGILFVFRSLCRYPSPKCGIFLVFCWDVTVSKPGLVFFEFLLQDKEGRNGLGTEKSHYFVLHEAHNLRISHPSSPVPYVCPIGIQCFGVDAAFHHWERKRFHQHDSCVPYVATVDWFEGTSFVRTLAKNGDNVSRVWFASTTQKGLTLFTQIPRLEFSA